MFDVPQYICFKTETTTESNIDNDIPDDVLESDVE